MTIPFTVRVFKNPYDHRVPDRHFVSLMNGLASRIATALEVGFSNQTYERNSLSVVILDPTLPLWAPTDTKAVLATISIGDEGDDRLINALAKAKEHRDHGEEAGVLRYTMPHRLRDGDFRYGYSVCVDGTYVGVSALKEFQDRELATQLAADFNAAIFTATVAWDAGHPNHRWFCDLDEPSQRYQVIIENLESMPTLGDD